MSHEEPSQLCLKGSLLLAEPSLREPTFHRTVILLTEHRHDLGAYGYVLNQPTGQTAGELLTSSDFAALATIPVFLGGPVETGQLTFASLNWEASAGLSYQTHLTREDAMRRIKEGEHVRALVGYSGWGAGQLENEIKQRSWIVAKPDASVADPANSSSLWTAILNRMGPWFRLVSRAPDDPSLN